MSRRGKIRVISYAVALVISLSAAIAACHVGAGGYTIRLDAQSERAFGEALSAVSRLQRSLNACAYATDAPMQSAICTQLYADSEAAETALSVLPVEMDALEEVSGQISVMGDYACLLSRAAAGGTTVSPKLFSVLTDFSDTVKLLSNQLSEIREAYAQGELRAESRLSLTDSLNNLEEEAGSAGETLNDAFHDLAASLPNSEPLVYDGKYSDHTGEKAFMLSGKAIISPTEARDRAAYFLLCDPSALQPLDFKGGEVPCWRFAYPELNASIAVTVRGGEVAQYLSDCLESGDADILIGTNRKNDLADLVRKCLEEREKRAASGEHPSAAPVINDICADIREERDFEEQKLFGTGPHIRANVKVQDGCDRFCSYCRIPLVRGRSRSRSPIAALEEISRLAADGCHEIVLNGIDLSSYHGPAGPDGRKEGLADLVLAAARIEGIERIRFGSLEQGIITPVFLEKLAGCGAFCHSSTYPCRAVQTRSWRA